MIRHFLHRSLVAVLRFIVATGILLLLIEFSFHVLRGLDHHIWEMDLDRPVPSEWESRPMGWREFLMGRALMTGRAILIAVLGIWWIGYTWGILGTRLRRYYGTRILAAPFALLACVPGFWLVVLVALYSYVFWQRPGFANDLVVEQGPDLLTWWHALVVAFPAMAAGIAWQIRSVATVLEREASKPWLRRLHLAGYNDEEIFYGNIVKRGRGDLIRLADGSIAALLGALIVLESAFRYPGMGSLLVDSLRSGDDVGTLFSALWFTGVSLAFTWMRELLSPPEISS